MARSRVSLKKAILRAGMSQAEVARKMNVTEGAITRWVKGERAMTLKNGLRLAKLLGVPPELLDV